MTRGEVLPFKGEDQANMRRFIVAVGPDRAKDGIKATVWANDHHDALARFIAAATAWLQQKAGKQPVALPNYLCAMVRPAGCRRNDGEELFILLSRGAELAAEHGWIKTEVSAHA